MITLSMDPKRGDTVVMVVTGTPDDPVILWPGDHLAFTDPRSGFTMDVKIRHSADEGFPPTIDKVERWLEARGVEITRSDVLDLIRIWNGWDGPVPA